MYTLQPLSVELGPGILGNIFDGIQVCLNSICIFNMISLLIYNFTLDLSALSPSNAFEFYHCRHKRIFSLF